MMKKGQSGDQIQDYNRGELRCDPEASRDGIWARSGPRKQPEPVAKIKKRRRRRKPVAEPVIVTAEPKTVMQLIFEGQRAQLDRLNEELQKKVFGET
ncbi:MAG TPA: hypothetical protein VIH58_03680 [Chthoniobacterales bacterium]|jgi:hypothetical protein